MAVHSPWPAPARPVRHAFHSPPDRPYFEQIGIEGEVQGFRDDTSISRTGQIGHKDLAALSAGGVVILGTGRRVAKCQHGRRAQDHAPRHIRHIPHDALNGASTPEKACTAGGRRSPFTMMAETAAVSSAASAGVKSRLAAPIFCILCAICVVPGIGTIHGRWSSNQASAICAGAAPFYSAQPLSRVTRARFDAILSPAKRVSYLRMSPSA